MPFKLGKDSNRGKGGKREGAGRPEDWLKEKCREMVKRGKLIEFMFDVADGKKVATYITELGHLVKVPAGIKDRRGAAEYLIDRGWGKVPQGVQMTGEDGEPLTINLVQYSDKE